MPTIDEALQIALAHHRAGEVAGAEAIYRKILAVAPDHLEALRFLAQARLQENDHSEARRLAERALALDPDYAEIHVLKAQALGGGGRWAEAAQACRAALAVNGGYAAAWDGLGVALRRLGDGAGAVSAHEKAVALRPEAPGFRHNLGVALHEAGRKAEAAEQYRQVLRLSPGASETLAALAQSLAEAGRTDEADGLEKAAKCTALVKSAKRIIAGGDFSGGAEMLVQALAIAGDRAEANCLLGDALFQENRLAEAEAAFSAVSPGHPSFPAAREGVAFCRLAGGDLAGGWVAWSDRPLRLPFQPDLPRWGGEELAGKSLLLLPEGGVGDELLFASCLPELLSTAGQVALLCDPRLHQIFQRAFPSLKIVDKALYTLSGFNFYAPIGDLPVHFRKALSDFPPRSSYLKADSQAVEEWRSWLDGLGEGRKIGISWRSLNIAAHRRHFYMDLAEWEPILRREDCRFITLQGGDTADELAEAERRFGVVIHRPPGLDLVKDIEGQAGLIAGLDAVICPTTMLSVLSAALGTPTMTFTTDPEPFRFGREDYPWLPSLCVFVRRREEGWRRVAEAIADRTGRTG